MVKILLFYEYEVINCLFVDNSTDISEILKIYHS